MLLPTRKPHQSLRKRVRLQVSPQAQGRIDQPRSYKPESHDKASTLEITDMVQQKHHDVGS